MKEITIDDLKQRLESGQPVAVVDIRETDEFDDWHIHGSTNVPVYNAISVGETTAVTEGFKGYPQDTPIVISTV